MSQEDLSSEAMVARLANFLALRLPHARSIIVSGCQQMTGGYSCVMTRFTANIDGKMQQLIARSDSQAGQQMLETDRMQEWGVLSALTQQNGVPMPRALFADEDGSELGAKTIIIEYAEGGSFLNRIRSGSDADYPEHARSLCDLAVELHGVDISRLADVLEQPKDWDAYLDGLIASWRKTESELSDSVPMLRYMAAWLAANRPPPTPLTLVHGEFQPSNQVLDGGGKLLAVDFEFVHIGDPREDLGWCKWVEAVQPPVLIGLDDAGFCRRYCEKSGLGEDVVNPLTMAYFSILPAIRVFSGVLKSQQAFSEGSNSSVRVAYIVGATVTAYEGWLQATRQIEAAAKVMKGVSP